MKKKQVKIIITHPGIEHQDDFIACCLGLAANPEAVVYRRDPIQAELNNPNIWVIDIGGSFDPHRNNYDHHQMESTAKCSVDLVLEGMGLLEDARESWPWLEYVTMQDNCGIAGTAGSLGILPQKYLAIKGPIGQAVTRMFQNEVPGIQTVMRSIGNDLLKQLSFRKHRLLTLGARKNSMFQIKEYRVMDMRGFDSPGAYMFEAYGPHRPQLIIMDSMRGDGAVIKSEHGANGPNMAGLNDSTFVDFSHKAGFLVDLVKGVDPIEFLENNL